MKGTRAPLTLLFLLLVIVLAVTVVQPALALRDPGFGGGGRKPRTPRPPQLGPWPTRRWICPDPSVNVCLPVIPPGGSPGGPSHPSRPTPTPRRVWRPTPTPRRVWRPTPTPRRVWRPTPTPRRVWRPTPTPRRVWRPTPTPRRVWRPTPTPTPPPPPPPVRPNPGGIVARITLASTTTHPVVIGQDPDRRGADVIVTIRSYPVTYTWFEYDTRSRRWERRVATVTDYVNLDSIRLTATLTRESREWIRTELAARYPGARVHQPDWNLRALATYRVVRSRVLWNGAHEVVLSVSRIPFRDPGVYRIWLAARTRGTSWPGSGVDPRWLVPPASRGTGPRPISAASRLKVWLLDATLSR